MGNGVNLSITIESTGGLSRFRFEGLRFEALGFEGLGLEGFRVWGFRVEEFRCSRGSGPLRLGLKLLMQQILHDLSILVLFPRFRVFTLKP